MARLTSIFWRDIPAQVIGQAGRTRVKRELPPRFAQAIDRAAMRAGRGASDAYLADWRRESEEVEATSSSWSPRARPSWNAASRTNSSSRSSRPAD